MPLLMTPLACRMWAQRPMLLLPLCHGQGPLLPRHAWQSSAGLLQLKPSTTMLQRTVRADLFQ